MSVVPGVTPELAFVKAEGAVAMPDISKHFFYFQQSAEKPSLQTQARETLRISSRLWLTSLLIFVITFPLFPLIAGSFTFIDGQPCMPNDTFASVTYLSISGLLSGLAPIGGLIWSYGLRQRSLFYSAGVYIVVQVGLLVVLIHLKLSDWRLILQQGLLLIYWLGAGCWHFMQLQQTSFARALAHYGIFVFLIVGSIISMWYVFQYTRKWPNILYGYRFVVHPLWYWVCIRACGWLVACGWTRATSLAVQAVPFTFMLTKCYIGRYVSKQLPLVQFAIVNLLLAGAEALNYITFLVRRKYLAKLMPSMQDRTLPYNPSAKLPITTVKEPPIQVQTSTVDASSSCTWTEASQSAQSSPREMSAVTLLVDNLHITTLLADVILEPLVALQLSACEVMFFWIHDRNDPANYLRCASEVSIVLAIQLPLGIFLLWWTRYKHNLSMPSVISKVIGRHFLVWFAGLTMAMAITSLRTMLASSQGFNYQMPFC
uniref:Uncharacterized protein n=1 Tax=Eutreptiella gymnastica TaxID=73025 RepID=A0A7S1JAP9_9EUGL|mmetsp:Transcript_78030/g.137662  ORF Transcript_78030/g.137662 Transcript_78030/m.137662 type:complete len:486 (+) Transcript_78030:148-1605(+)